MLPKIHLQLTFISTMDRSVRYIIFVMDISHSRKRLEIFANGGIFVLDNFKSLKGYGSEAFVPHTLFKQNKGQKECAEAFIDAVVSGLDSPIPLDDIIRVHEILLNI